MALATTTQPGEVRLAGDLGGNNDANNPSLPDTGVTPGTYTPAIITINSKGLATDASNATHAQILAILGFASDSNIGLVSIPSGSPNLDLQVDGSGELSLGTNVARRDEPNTFTATQSVEPVALVSTGSPEGFNPDGQDTNVYTMTMTEDATLNNFANPITGAFYTFIVKQDGTGFWTLTYGDDYIFSGGTKVITGTANDYSIITCLWDGSKMLTHVNREYL